MLKKISTLSAVALTLLMTACKKDSQAPTTTTGNTIVGTWSVAGIDVNQSTTVIGIPYDGSDSAKEVVSAIYPITTVAGSFVFTTDSLYVSGFSYSASPTVDIAMYQWPSLVLDSTSSQPAGTVSRDPADYAFPYAGITGKDSVAFPEGSISFPSLMIPISLTPRTGSYVFAGDTLKLTMATDTAIDLSMLGGNSSNISYFGSSNHLVLKLVKNNPQ